MTCSNNWARPLTSLSAWLLLFIFLWCGGGPCVAEGNATSRSLKQYLISNLSLCELNTTDLPGGYSFTYLEEYWVIAPFICYLIGFTAKTLSLTCDMLVVVPIFGVAAHLEAWYVFAMFIPSVLVLGACFIYQCVITFMSWRYACTRHTSFVKDGNQVGPISSHVLLVRAGKVLTKAGYLKPSLVVLNGRKATELTSVACSHYQ
nr:MAG: putative glycoprotein 4 [Jingmen shrew arterivirus 1]